MKKIFFILSVCLASIFTPITSFAEESSPSQVELYINDVKIPSENGIIIHDNCYWLPFRAIMEELGSTVIWDENTGNILFNYKNKNYACKSRPVRGYNFPPTSLISICEKKYLNSDDIKDYIQLNPMGCTGFTITVNDRTYLDQYAACNFWQALGCDVKIDYNNKIVKISS